MVEVAQGLGDLSTTNAGHGAVCDANALARKVCRTGLDQSGSKRHLAPAALVGTEIPGQWPLLPGSPLTTA